MNQERSMASRRLLPLLPLLLAGSLHATLATGKVFGSHMVLQREVAVPVFGTGASGEAVTVTFNGQTKTATTASNGTWKVSLDAMNAGGPFTLTIKGTNTLSYTDVMVGEVWHCAGQSNMDTRMNYSEYPNLADSIKTANYPNLRYITMRQPGATIQWQQVSPTTAGAMSATGYFFGRHLLDNLKGVAVGIVNTSVGGTIIEQWLDPATKAADATLRNDTTAGTMYDAWVKPVEGYGVKGTVWLQGENNTSSALYKAYGDRLQKMIPGWRKAWNQPDMPFLVAGLCHKGVLQTAAGEASNEASIRESQRTVTDTLRRTWLSVLVDLGDDATWHYPQKPEAGRRLGLLARGAVDGQTGFVFQSPKPVQCFKRGTTIAIPFDARGSSLKLSSGTTPTGFEVAGSDNKWSWASTATLKGDTVFLTTAVATPTQVRFAWANQPIMNLFSAAGLPATPFQSAIASGVGVEPKALPQGLRARAGSWSFPLEGSALVSVRDLRGRVLRETRIAPVAGEGVVDARGLSRGMLLLEVRPDGAAAWSARVLAP